ncbi:MAG: hypothetical protein AMS27_07730 [Bacteroides sp. SM23_62_1]|nr:MAG: hypothetical protein AMS27_07730 [Bacteroides sp. SM23_62_1]
MLKSRYIFNTGNFSGYFIAVVLKPADGTSQITFVQTTIIEIAAVCKPILGTSETAWAGGYQFPGQSWARFFTFCK